LVFLHFHWGALTATLIYLLILRICLLTLPKDAAVSLSEMLKSKGKGGKEKQRFTKEDLVAILQQVYLDDATVRAVKWVRH